MGLFVDTPVTAEPAEVWGGLPASVVKQIAVVAVPLAAAVAVAAGHNLGKRLDESRMQESALVRASLQGEPASALPIVRWSSSPTLGAGAAPAPSR